MRRGWNAVSAEELTELEKILEDSVENKIKDHYKQLGYEVQSINLYKKTAIVCPLYFHQRPFGVLLPPKFCGGKGD